MLVGLLLSIYICFCEPEVYINVENMNNRNKKHCGDYDVTLLLTSIPRGARWRHRSSSTVNPKTDEEVKELVEGWHDIYVQGRPHWDGTGNANYYWCVCDPFLHSTPLTSGGLAKHYDATPTSTGTLLPGGGRQQAEGLGRFWQPDYQLHRRQLSPHIKNTVTAVCDT